MDQCSSGILRTPNGDIEIFKDDYSPGVLLEPFHASSAQIRISVLSILSPLDHDIRLNPSVKAELNAAETPFNNFDELVSLLSLNRDNNAQVSMEFVCFQSARINKQNSYVTNGGANIEVAIARDLDPKAFSLGVRQSKGGIAAAAIDVERFSISGDEFKWEEKDSYLLGTVSFPTEKLDVIQCFANYGGVNYENYWLSDPDAAANPRRVALQLFDKDLNLNTAYLFEGVENKTGADEFEAGLSWMFWMLGFSSVQIDLPNKKKRPNDAPDFLFCDDRSNFLIVEATVGALQNNLKLNKLWERSIRLKTGLENSSLGHLEVIPLIITKQSEPMVEQDLETAQKLGIRVFTRENLQTLIERTRNFPNPNIVFDELKLVPEQK